MTESTRRIPERSARPRPAPAHLRASPSAGSTPAGGTDSDTASSLVQCQPNSPSNLKPVTSSSIQRQDSSDSNDGGIQSDSKWFHQFNQNPSANLDTMDVDPPFFQNQSGGSEAGPRDPIPHELLPTLRAAAAAGPSGAAKSSSTEDYRSVIDDLTVEIRRLKDELRRYRHAEDDGALRKQRLFEIKTHGLPQWKKRELEATLRDFAAGVGSTPTSTDVSSSLRKKSSRASRLKTGSSAMSKHASSSSGSHLRPVDSAYASMSTGNTTSGNSAGRHPQRASSRDTEQKVESYLNDIPEGLYPRHITMSNREKKKLVVRRLEQLFTGKAGGGRRAAERAAVAPPATEEAGSSREARILPTTNPKGRTASGAASGSAGQSSTNVTSERNTDLTSWSGNKSGGNDNASGSGSGRGGGGGGHQSSNISPGSNPPFEQRPTRPRDLDPDRPPDPSENMEYLRHLGVTPAPGQPGDAGARASGSPTGVAADAEGWVYLNLLSNLAQLHIFNVAPSFVRAAVAEKSAKFQLSGDGRKIRWRGGGDGTAFSSESSGQGSGEGDEGGSSEGSRKRRRRGGSGSSSRGTSFADASESFHYKPLFARVESPAQMERGSSGSAPESGGDSRSPGSGDGSSRSASSRRRKRRVDGAIIYYSGQPFCMDLSGDPGCLAPSTDMASSGSQEGSGEASAPSAPLAYRPLSKKPAVVRSASGMDTSSDAAVEASDGELEAEFPWSDSKQVSRVRPLEPCGLGGVVPEDNFVLTVTTLRPKEEAPQLPGARPEIKAAEVAERLAGGKRARPSTPLDISYVGGRIKRLRPATLPPPAVFLPPFSSSDESSEWGGESGADDEASLQPSSRRVHPHQSDKSFGLGAMSAGGGLAGEEEGESSADEVPGAESVKGVRGRGRDGGRRGSLAATAGGASSGYSSSKEGSR